MRASSASAKSAITIRPYNSDTDLSSVEALEKANYQEPWTREMLSTCEGFVALAQDRRIGYAFVEDRGSVMVLTNIVVHKQYRRKKVATLLLTETKKLKPSKASKLKRGTLRVFVREMSLPLQLCLKANGFLANKVIPDYFGDQLPAYRMDFKLVATKVEEPCTTTPSE